MIVPENAALQYNETMIVHANDTAPPASNVADLAVRDVQRRLSILGYDLGIEAEAGLYGEKTAAAVSAFKMSTQLPAGEMLDQATWIALVDASLTMGDRPLFLHRPHFQGRDVATLQRILFTLGFPCNIDGIFDPSTESAVRDFQRSLALDDRGIVDEGTYTALSRLRHAWEGKGGTRVEGRPFDLARAIQVLETVPICVYGVSEATRSMADRISNLAHATTSRAQVMSASSLTRPPAADVLVVGLIQTEDSKEIDDDGLTLAQRIQDAVAALSEGNRRVLIPISSTCGGALDRYREQRCAIEVLDALCASLVFVRCADLALSPRA
ncbi:MAG: peptidoglycan-binding protein [Coriobacteriia bacterium]|nr:peptidoglycan-binding protein [Coriobacteriia bacterium]